MAWSNLTPEQKTEVATDLAREVLEHESVAHEPHKATVTTETGFSVVYEDKEARTTVKVADEAAQDFAAMGQDYVKFSGMEFCRRHIRTIRNSVRRTAL